MSYVDALPVGAQVERYVIEAVLGQGGFGIVYRARHPEYGVVALKEFFPKSQASRINDGSIVPSTPRSEEAFAKGVERLIEEGAKLKGMKHPNIIRVIDVFEKNGTGYLAMEAIEGPTLQEAIDSGKLSCDKGVVEAFMAQVLDALKLVHAAGLIHRDIAPDNILVDFSSAPPRFVLIDFGGAKRVVTDVSENSSKSLTKTGFSAPEQYGSETSGGIKATPATDVYGLAASLYWMMTKRRPVDAPNRVIQDTLLPLAKDADLVAIYGHNWLSAIDRSMAILPGERPASIADFERMMVVGAPKPGKQGGGARGPMLIVSGIAGAALLAGAAAFGGFFGGTTSPQATEAAATIAATEGGADDLAVNPSPDPSAPVAAPTVVVTQIAAATERTAGPQVIREVINTQAPAEVPRAPVCTTVNRQEQRCGTAYRTEQQCSPQTSTRTVSVSGAEEFFGGGYVSTASQAEGICRQQVKAGSRADLEAECDGNLGAITPSCNCDYDSSSSTGASCSYRARASCTTTKDVCRSVSVPYDKCEMVNVPEQVCR